MSPKGCAARCANRGTAGGCRFPASSGSGRPRCSKAWAEARALLEARAVVQPFGSYIQPLRLHAKRGRYRPAVIACNGFREIAAAQPQIAGFLTPEWRRYDLPTGHWPMLSAPEPLAELLDQASRDGATK
jgi:hypothetical protein